ncbi:arsenical resistance protein ArsH [Flagellatimonas centrodinii]|uniref:arsenical resistance protein ArsH n=1 Tax=Flagellatimonas centrodinii TaxID=2806210 RepID=UPI001FED46C3|nr:arsenical resistance protein ArsH [Flagellatimonas centrodinii]ULQ48115.1 arsenical resistance protein ArsH [Flagellatimonas centrodinii]
MLRTLPDPHHLPALDPRVVQADLAGRLGAAPGHPPRVLLLYGSLRPVSYSRLLVEEAARLLIHFGCEVRIFDPAGLPQPDSPEAAGHPEVEELRALSLWSEAQVWCSPERHGAITAVLKNQIDHIPLAMGAVRPTQGRTLAVMQVSGGSQSFNAVNTLRLLGRWMRMITIPNQSSVAQAWQEFDAQGRMKPSAYYERVVDVMEELVKFTLLTRHHDEALVDRYSERRAALLKAEAAASRLARASGAAA